MKPAIRVENLGKCYRVAHNQERGGYRTLRDSIVDAVKSPFRRMMNGAESSQAEDFWALSDVSFDVRPGEVVGIIGRNGAGKSTLLKILSRITKPSKGRVELNGRVGSLLEVGTGFHPELTGRENVYLNGSILGMSRKEIDRRFDEIVAFAEVDRFLDTPVKRYSSGMYVRLAFAVAAHLEPEILIVDEVLSVGDTQFQEKCIGKIGDVAKGGNTVLFVSHNMQAVSMLCSRAFLLRKGAVCQEGTAREVVRTYLESNADQISEVHWGLENAPGNEVAKLRSVRVLNDRGEPGVDHDITTFIDVALEFWVLQGGSAIDSSIHLLNDAALCLFAVGAELPRNGPDGTTQPGLYRTTCRIPANFLNDGRHFVSAFVVRNSADVVVNVPQAVTFMAHDFGTNRGSFTGKIIGAVRPLLAWDVKRIGACG